MVTKLSKANSALRNGDILYSIACYEEALGDCPLLKSVIEGNINVALRRIKNSQLSNVQMLPIAGIQAEPEIKNRWLATTEDPHFELLFNNQNPIIAGWYEITIFIETEDKKMLLNFISILEMAIRSWMQFRFLLQAVS